MVYDNAIEAGNKLIANVGLVSMYGKKRNFKLTRLTQPVFKGEMTFHLEPNLDIVKGDVLAIAPTSYFFEASDEVIVESYDATTGKTTTLKGLTTYHWGAPVSPTYKYGIDTRAEVTLLSRNIRIVGEDIESWGAQIVTSDTIEWDLTVRQGQLFMDNVEVYNASQANTEKAAIRFEGNTGLYSAVTNCAIHNGAAWGVHIKESANILFKDNIVFRMKPFSFVVSTSRNITLDGNVAISTVPREKDYDKTTMAVDLEAAFAICSVKNGDRCSDISIVNNIAAGATYAGFVVPAHDCGDTNQKLFRDNIAHSVWGKPRLGLGAFIFPDPAKNHDSTCYEGSKFTAYKCAEQGAFMFFKGI